MQVLDFGGPCRDRTYDQLIKSQAVQSANAYISSVSRGTTSKHRPNDPLNRSTLASALRSAELQSRDNLNALQHTLSSQGGRS